MKKKKTSRINHSGKTDSETVESIFPDDVRIYDLEALLNKRFGNDNDASAFHVKCWHAVYHTTSINTLIETKGGMEVMAAEADEESAVVEDSAEWEEVENALTMVDVVAMEAVVVAAEDE